MSETWSVVLVVPRGPMLLAQARRFVSRDRNFPGGDRKFEDATPEQTAARELLEETGLTVDPFDLTLLDTWQNELEATTHVFLVTKFRGRLRASSEGKVFWTSEYRSLTKPTSTFASSNARILQKLLQLRPVAQTL